MAESSETYSDWRSLELAIKDAAKRAAAQAGPGVSAASVSAQIWATRGRAWGFRFLLDAGLDDPLPEYERMFTRLSEASTAWRREGTRVALRFPDPQGRRDAAGRVIPHEFVLVGDVAGRVASVDDGLRQIWPLVKFAYGRIWDADKAPRADELRFEA